MTDAALGALGAELTAVEAAALAERFAARFSLGKALQGVSGTRRERVRTLLVDAGLTGDATTVAVLRAIEGANRRTTSVEPVWTLPGNRADYGRLTSSVADLVLSARTSVTCTTYNFEESSSLWEGLREVSTRPGVAVTVYVDAKACAKRTPQAIAAQLRGARVLASTTLDGRHVRSHAKIVCVDHRFLVVSSANLSVSGELYNVELGLRVDDPALSQLVEAQLSDIEKDCYVLVTPMFPAITTP
jgi:phosphatidylserine/phosphatidylglycerophosphate/cardiolipin synthase-like enzyme